MNLLAMLDKVMEELPPEAQNLSTVICKEILHQDILYVLMEQGVLQKMVFIGGTSLRLCYDSERLSEDLDFYAGFDFVPASLDGLEEIIKAHLSQ